MMRTTKHTLTLAAAAMLLASAVGCQKDDKSMEKALSRINDRLGKIEKKIDNLPKTGAGARPSRPARPPGPDPKAIYSVNIEGAPYTGVKDAKITIVEAFDFA